VENARKRASVLASALARISFSNANFADGIPGYSRWLCETISCETRINSEGLNKRSIQ